MFTFQQVLLKKVYQESCRILTLSQRCVMTQPLVSDLKLFSLGQTEHQESDDASSPLDHRDKSSTKHPMSWQQEKRALQETVIALRELLCRMAQRYSEVSLGILLSWEFGIEFNCIVVVIHVFTLHDGPFSTRLMVVMFGREISSVDRLNPN